MSLKVKVQVTQISKPDKGFEESRKGAELGPMLLLTINRKPCNNGESNDTSTSDLESRSLGFQNLISHKGAELVPMLLLTITRKLYVATTSQLTSCDLERSGQGH